MTVLNAPLPDPGARTHCPYCAMQCGMLIGGTAHAPSIAGDAAFPVNRGALCIKGWTAIGALNHPERLTTPLVRAADGSMAPASWDEALDRVADGMRALQLAHGPDAVGVYGSGALTNEKAYQLGKFARVALRSRHIDYNGRFCMASAAAAANAAFGIDRGLPFPLADLAEAGAILLVGSNVAETLPTAMQYLDAQRRAGGHLIVVDPRRTPTAAAATLHLPLVPGTDAMLAGGLLHVLVRDGLIDEAYIGARTTGFAGVRAAVAACWPGRVERITGVAEADIVRAAHLLGTASSAMVLTARGAEQQAQGVANTLAFINIALALGQVGRRGGGFGCLTGQGNGQGGREHGQKADQLPGYRSLRDLEAREHVAAVWGVDADSLPPPGISAFELLDALGTDGGPRGLIVVGSNPAVSAPASARICTRLRALDLLVVCDFFLSETAAIADVVLPVAMWAEEEGTMTNLEGRVLRRRRIFAPPMGVRTDLEILSGLATRLGRGEGFARTDPAAVFEELSRASAGGVADYGGITYARLDAGEQIHWPCTDAADPGTPRLFADDFPTPDRRARFHVVTPSDPAEAPDGEYPLYLTTGRVLAQYQSGTQTRRQRELVDRSPAPYVELHPVTARQHDLGVGDIVTVRTRRGSATLQVRITDTARVDTVFVPFHWSGLGAANLLTNPALDPTSRMPEFKVCAARLELRVAESHATSPSEALVSASPEPGRPGVAQVARP